MRVTPFMRVIFSTILSRSCPSYDFLLIYIIIPKDLVILSTNEVKGKGRQIKGKVREEVGKLTNNKKEQAKGKVEQVEGKAREKLGKAQRKSGKDR